MQCRSASKKYQDNQECVTEWLVTYFVNRKQYYRVNQLYNIYTVSVGQQECISYLLYSCYDNVFKKSLHNVKLRIKVKEESVNKIKYTINNVILCNKPEWSAVTFQLDKRSWREDETKNKH